jgi:hypothetical protein
MDSVNHRSDPLARGWVITDRLQGLLQMMRQPFFVARPEITGSNPLRVSRQVGNIAPSGTTTVPSAGRASLAARAAIRVDDAAA